MSVVLIVNPFASGVTEERLAAVVRALGPGVTVVRTHERGHATDLARELDGTVEAIHVFAGDGTYNEVLNGVAGRTPLGFVPGGGTSVLPRALGLPRGAVAAARRLAVGQPRRIALGRANGRRFGFSAGVGLDAELVRRVDALGRRSDGVRPGDRAFVRAGLGLLREHGFRLEPRLELVGIGPVAFALVANCDPYTYAGRLALRLAPDATFEGGLDVVAPTSVSRAALPLVAWWALGHGRRHVRLHDVGRAELRSLSPEPLQLDGEDVGDVTEVLLEAEPAAVTVLV